MKRTLFFTGAIIFLLLIYTACSKNSTDSSRNDITDAVHTTTRNTLVIENIFNENIGGPVLRKDAEKWFARYAAQNANAANTKATYNVHAGYLKKIMNTQKDVVCIALYLIETEEGLDVLPAGVSAKGRLIKTATVMTVRGKLLSWEEGRSLRNAFTGTVKAYIFGTNTFKRLIEVQHAETIAMQFGMKETGQTVLVLSDAANTTSVEVEDESRRCPEFCPIDESL